MNINVNKDTATDLSTGSVPACFPPQQQSQFLQIAAIDLKMKEKEKCMNSKPKSAAAARAGETPTGLTRLVAARADAISTTPPPETQLLQTKSFN